MPLKYINRNNTGSPAGNSVEFNGSSRWLTSTRTGGWLKSGNNFTIECWVYFTRHPTAYGGIYNTCIAGTLISSRDGWEFLLQSSTNGATTTGVGFNSRIGTTQYGFGATIGLNINTWYHIALVRNGTTMTIYVNGTSAGTSSIASWTERTDISIGRLSYSPYFYYFPGYISNFRIVDGTAVYTSNFTPPVNGLTAISNTALLTCNAATIVDASTNNYTITNNGSATVSTFSPFSPFSGTFKFSNRSNNTSIARLGFKIATVSAAFSATQKAIFGYGYPSSGTPTSVTNLVSNTGVVAGDTAGVGTARYGLAAAGYGTDKAIFGYGVSQPGNVGQSITNLVSNTGVVATDTTGVGTVRWGLAAAGYGTDKAIFGYGYTGNSGTSVTNLVSNTGVVATDTTGVGTARYGLAATGYGTDKAIFGYGGVWYSMTNLVSNTGVVATDTTGVGTARDQLAATRYGTGTAMFGYGSGATGFLSMTNKISNTGVVATDTTGVGTARYNLAAAGYGTDKAIFGYGTTNTWVTITNLVNNTGVVATDNSGVGTARYSLAAAGYSLT